jgi:hypothetical protein
MQVAPTVAVVLLLATTGASAAPALNGIGKPGPHEHFGIIEDLGPHEIRRLDFELQPP